jgi:hypothetical protein
MRESQHALKIKERKKYIIKSTKIRTPLKKALIINEN